MKRSYIVLIFLFTLVLAKGQKIIPCRPVFVQKLDSVVNYVRDSNTGVYTPTDVFVYQFAENGIYPVIDRFDLPARTPVNRQNYFYNESGQKTHYILQDWNGSGYTDLNRTDYYYNESGYLALEVFSGSEDNQWIPYQQHVYNYDENSIVLTYLRQMMYSAGVWTDFSYKNYIYDSRGMLIERNEQRIADGVIFWAEQFTYDDKGRTAIRIRQSLKYYPVTRTYVMENLNKQIYSYDIYGDLSEYAIETWINNSWFLTGKSVYFRTLLYGTRVPVCFNGNTIIVPVNILERILERGGLLGACRCHTDIKSADDIKAFDNSKTKEGSSPKVVLYPNPASSQITVWFPELTESCYTDLNIYNGSGSLVIKERIADQLLSIDISHLTPGSYRLSLTGEGGAYTTTFVKK